MTLSSDHFEFICRFLDEQAGIALEADQNMFVASRLLPVAQRHGWTNLDSLINKLRDHHDRLLAQEVVESLVTHETSFFRDPHYFDELTEHTLPRIIACRVPERRLAIWCAACSTGQEAYSVAMILQERFAEQLRDWSVDLLASDLSATALQQAQSGCYTEVEIRRGLSDARRAQHFRRESTCWRINDRLRQMVRFQKTNLNGTWPQLPTFDLVLLRNVLIYMTPSTRQSILTRIRNSLHPTGYLMLGSTESTNFSSLQIARGRVGSEHCM